MSFHDSQHATAPGAELDEVTGWQVVSFADPAGAGGDLAFTQGLWAFDRPELLLWARPTEGFDPGADWLLTHRERSRLLNHWAIELITGNLSPGAEREERFDGGHTVARFRFARPTVASPLQHPYLPPASRVICTAWSLRRRALTQPPAPLDATAARRMERWIAAAEAVTLGWRLRPDSFDSDGTPNSLELDPRPGLDPHPGLGPGLRLGLGLGLGLGPGLGLGLGSPSADRFGPLTRWVDARIRQVLAADTGVIAAFLDRLELARQARCEDCLLEDLARLATRSHRDDACREAARAAQDLGLTVAGALERSAPPWLGSPAARPGTPEPEVDCESSLRTILSDGLEVLLMSAVLTDVATPSLLAGATGAWEWAANDHQLPGRLWLARPATRQAARDLLAPTTPTLLTAAVEHARETTALAEGQALSRLVAGLQTTAGASAQPGALLRRDQIRGLPRSIVTAADQLAGQLLTAMTLPYRFPEDRWDLLRQSLRPLVPTEAVVLRAEIP